MTVQELLDAGYRPFRDQFKEGRYYEGSYQKHLTDNVGTLYFITVSHIRYEREGQTCDGFEGSVQMTIGKPGHGQESDSTGTEAYEVFDVGYHATGQNVALMQAFFAHLWQRMNADYYERSA